jgi:hypothetical protein
MTAGQPPPAAATARRERISRRLAWRLGWRFLRVREPRRIVSLCLIVVGVGIAILAVLGAIAAFTVVGARQDRTLARALADATDSDPATAWVDIHRQPYGDRMVLRVDVALSPNPPPPPPGIARWPVPGEILVSPAFQAASAADSVLMAYAPGRVGGPVGASGLRSPDELVVYRGVDRAALPRGGSGIVARTDQAPSSLFRDTLDMPGHQVAGLAGVVVVCLGLPVLAFLAVAARLSASTRARRLAVLHFLGVPPATVRAINSVEVLVLALAGAAWALLAYPVVNVLLAGSHLAGITWYPRDTALGPRTAALVVVTVVLLAGLAARRVDRGDTLTSTRTRRTARPGVVSTWRLVPLALGLCTLVGQVAVGFARPAGTSPYPHLDLIMLVAVLLTGFGLLWAISPLTHLAGRLAHHRGRGLAVRLGGARAAFDPAGTARLIAGLGILVFAVGVTIGQTRDARAVSDPTTATVDVAVNAEDLPSPAAGARLLATTPAPGVTQVFTAAANPHFLSGTVADCAEIGRFLGLDATAMRGCGANTAYWSPSVAATERTLAGLPLPATLVARSRSRAMPAFLAELLPDVDVLVTAPAASVLTAADPAATVHTDSAKLVLRAPRERVDATFASVYTVAPYSQPTAFGLDPDSHENLAMINGYIRLGLLGGALMALFALIAALADRTTERRRADHELLAAGAARQLVRRAHRWEVALTVGVALATAGVSGILGGLAWQLAGGLDRTVDWTSTAELLGFATVMGLLVCFAAAAVAPTSPDPSILRSE